MHAIDRRFQRTISNGQNHYESYWEVNEKQYFLKFKTPYFSKILIEVGEGEWNCLRLVAVMVKQFSISQYWISKFYSK